MGGIGDELLLLFVAFGNGPHNSLGYHYDHRQDHCHAPQHNGGGDKKHIAGGGAVHAAVYKHDAPAVSGREYFIAVFPQPAPLALFCQGFLHKPGSISSVHRGNRAEIQLQDIPGAV